MNPGVFAVPAKVTTHIRVFFPILILSANFLKYIYNKFIQLKFASNSSHHEPAIFLLDRRLELIGLQCTCQFKEFFLRTDIQLSMV
jgi:hypothetical protein